MTTTSRDPSTNTTTETISKLFSDIEKAHQALNSVLSSSIKAGLSYKKIIARLKDLEARITQIEDAAKTLSENHHHAADRASQIMPISCSSPPGPPRPKYQGCSNCKSEGATCSLLEITPDYYFKPCDACEENDLPCSLYQDEEPELDAVEGMNIIYELTEVVIKL